ncbi:MAG TPA: response regulator [Cytophagales bacterium]|nr:response regulator [Cytophagales bacterium]
MLNCILVIDDDAITRQLYSMILEEMEVSDRVEAFPYGVQAIEFINTFTPEIILMDLNMPGIDGFEVIEELNKNKNRREMKVIVMSAHFAKGQQTKIKELGVDNYITKPLSEEKVNEVLLKPQMKKN